MFSRRFQVALAMEVFTEFGAGRMHDVMFELTAESMSDAKLKSFFMALPETIQCEALKWGLDDTVVADNIYGYYEKRLKDNG